MGASTRMRADRGELNAEAAIAFFKRFCIKLRLTIAYNPEGKWQKWRGDIKLL